MSVLALGLALVAALVILVLLGMHIAIALLLVGFVGIWVLRGNIDLAFRMLDLTAWNGIADYLFATIPLFVMMGLLVSASNVGRDTFAVAEVVLRRLVGGLGVATVAANTVFAAVTGVSIASAAVFTRVAVPEMRQHGYRPAFAAGTVAGSSILGMMIPPSLLMIVYGVLAEVSIGAMFIAGVIPGLLLASGFVGIIMLMARFFPGFVYANPKEARQRRTSVRTEHGMPAGEMLTKLLPIVVLVGLVLGGLYSGYFTPTEAGGVGAFGALLIAIARRSLNWQKMWDIIIQTGTISVSILLLLIAASFYSRMLSVAGLPNAISDLIRNGGFSPAGFLTMYILLIIVIGMILDSTSILLIVVPIMAPIAQSFGFDLIHFGVVTVLAVEMGLLTPPFGISVFTVHNTLNDPEVGVEAVFLGTIPFILVMASVLVLLAAVPQLTLMLL
jgi:C4-dicarboxylate transporter, DctM subunit